MSSMRKNVGFTIVELLIVIVVIGILAAITIVAYNGIQDRAKSSSNISTARSFVAAFTVLKIDSGLDTGVYCLGNPAAYSNGSCAMMGSTGTVNATINSVLAKNGAAVNATMNPKWYNGAIMYHGNWFGKNKVIIYTVGPSQECGLSNVLSVPYDNMTLSGAAYTDRNASHTTCFISLD